MKQFSRDASEFIPRWLGWGYIDMQSQTVGIASEAEMEEMYSVAKKCLNDGI